MILFSSECRQCNAPKRYLQFWLVKVMFCIFWQSILYCVCVSKANNKQLCSNKTIMLANNNETDNNLVGINCLSGESSRYFSV